MPRPAKADIRCLMVPTRTLPAPLEAGTHARVADYHGRSPGRATGWADHAAKDDAGIGAAGRRDMVTLTPPCKSDAGSEGNRLERALSQHCWKYLKIGETAHCKTTRRRLFREVWLPSVGLFSRKAGMSYFSTPLLASASTVTLATHHRRDVGDGVVADGRGHRVVGAGGCQDRGCIDDLEGLALGGWPG